LALVIGTSTLLNAQNYKAYEGFYWTAEKDAIIELTLTEGADGPEVTGRTRWSNSEAGFDTQNPDTALRDRPIIGLEFLWGFTYSPKKNRWKGGKVYDPKNGKTYSAKMSLDKTGKVLKMRGYVGISLLGRTAKFERVKQSDLPEELIDKPVL
jgi:hypothetical protein